MRTAIALILVLTGGVAWAGCCEDAKQPKPCVCEPTPWSIYAEALLNSDSNVEATLGAQVGQWMIDLRARDAVYDDVTTGWYPRMVEADDLEYELRTGLVFEQSARVVHGPVVNYTKRAWGGETWAAGWRVQLGSKP